MDEDRLNRALADVAVGCVRGVFGGSGKLN